MVGSALQRWHLVGVLTLANMCSYVDRSILTLLVGPIRRDLDLSDTQFSLLHGLAFALFYTTLGVAIALFADRMNRRNIIALGIAFWSAATALCGMARSFWQLFAARVAVGVGEATLAPSSYSMLADVFAPNRLGRPLAVFTAGSTVGAGVALLVGGAVVGALAQYEEITLPIVGTLRAWQVVFLVVGLPGVLVALWVLALSEPPRRHHQASAVPRSTAHVLRECMRHIRSQWQTYTAHFFGFTLLSLLFNAIAAWTPAFLIRVYDLPASRAGYWLGIIILIAGAPGMLAGGWLADRLRQAGYVDATMRTGIVAAVGVLPFAVTATLSTSLTASLACLVPAMFFATLPYGAAAAGVQHITPSQFRATTSALYLCCMNLVGMGAGPTLVAMITDRLFGYDAAVGYSIALACAISAPPAALALWLGLPHFRRSAAHLESLGRSGH